MRSRLDGEGALQGRMNSTVSDDESFEVVGEFRSKVTSQKLAEEYLSDGSMFPA